jgi:hypothetical protein
MPPNQGMRCKQLIRPPCSSRRRTSGGRDHFLTSGLDTSCQLHGAIPSGGPGNPIKPGDRPGKRRTLIDQLFDWDAQRREEIRVSDLLFQLVVRHLKLSKLSRRKSTSFGILRFARPPLARSIAE